MQERSGGRITASFIGQIETGRRLPGQETIDVIVETLGLDGEERRALIEAKASDRRARPDLGTGSAAEGARMVGDPLLAALHGDPDLPEETKQALIALVKPYKGQNRAR
jgi:hypothetical protein